MGVRTPHRLAVIAVPLVAAATVLGACGGSDDAGPSVSTIVLDTGSTAFQTVPPATTTTTIAGDAALAAGVQEYTVQQGDYPLKVADLFQVPLDDLINFNGWASVNEFPFPGSVIKIPPGGVDPTAGATATDTGDATATDTDEGTGDVAGDTIPEAGSNCEAGSYTIVEGDYLGKVADKFDVTVEALNAANVGTSGYSAFYPGLVIVIPAKADC